MDVKCPHCSKPITLIGTKELREVFHLTDNQIQHAREKGDMPEPWIALENRYLYVRKDIEDYIEARSRLKIDGAVKEILASIQNLPAAERDEARKVLEAELGGGKRRR